jgi:hypothetical protein
VLTAAIEQTLADVFIYCVWPIEPDRIKPLYLDRPKASEALDAKQLSRDFG